MVEGYEGRLPLERIAQQLGISRKTLWSWRREWNGAPVAQ
jgi:transposase-like protein